MESAKEAYESRNLDAFHDKPFIKAFVHDVQKIDPDITAYYFPATFQLVFVYKYVIIYKIILNKENLADISTDLHIKNIRSIILMMKNNIIPVASLGDIQQNTKKNFNKFNTGRLVS